MKAEQAIATDYATIPAGHKTPRVRGWRVANLRALAVSRRQFTARELLDRCPSMTIEQARALCQSYVRKGQLRVVRKGIGGSDSVEAIYARV